MKKSSISNVLKIIVEKSFYVFFISIFFGYWQLFQIAGKYFEITLFISIIVLPIFYLYVLVSKENHILLLICKTLIFIAPLVLSSLGMSYILYSKTIDIFEQSSLNIFVENLVKHAFNLSLLPYCIYNLMAIKRKPFKIIFKIILLFWIFNGFIQFAVALLNNDTVYKIYDYANILKIIDANSTIIKRIIANYGYFRFIGTTSEPSKNCFVICVFFLPLLVHYFVGTSKKKERILIAISALIVLAFALLTVSSSVYFGLLINVIYLIHLLIKRSSKKNKVRLIIFGSLAILIGIAFIIPYTRKLLTNTVLKIFDFTDYSTQHRYSSVYNDLQILLKFPLFGVGDGLQGFFYADNVAGTWMSGNPETQAAIKGETGFVNGGAAIPSLISGFGIIGCIYIYFNIRKYVKTAFKNNPANKEYLTLYKNMLACTILFLLVSYEIHRNYELFLVIASPFIFFYENEEKNKEIKYNELKEQSLFKISV